ncbi:cell division suppressor protein YneA [Alkalihalobacillus sp. CinArs1]|uniref:cell division suppressor protein YneA n=1 Tax=Alkalihalobacillus sp. CinArs1 TaxID=2995314 RepID=UPI0022DD3AB5|nr:cell division suppressor protein YneA [Alkalihalobacillus sp. CinArs1]
MRKQARGLSGIDFLVIISFVAVLIFVFVSLRAAAAEGYDRYTEIELERGDTVLEIAEEYRDAHELSDRNFISWVEEANKIDADRIVAGDTLIIPVEANATALGVKEK